MTDFRLGINTCFAVKRWPQPADWAAIVRDELGLDLVQHSLDLVGFETGRAGLEAQASQVHRACHEHGLALHSTFTGLAAYSANLLLHPDARRRASAHRWYRRVIDFTAEAGAGATGGHVGGYSVADFADPARRATLWQDLRDALADLAAYARQAGLEALMVENLASAREPSTIAGLQSLITPGDQRHVPVLACLDVGHQCVPGSAGDDADPYAWLRRLAPAALVIQLQQSDAVADRHWPFTPEANRRGRITAAKVLEAIEESSAAAATLILEVIHPFEAPDDIVLAELRASAEYWRHHLPSPHESRAGGPP
jgi:sugar phosphate isomerase/epimerase